MRSACLLGESIGHRYQILIPRPLPNIVCHICWPGCTRLIFETPQVCLHLVKIRFELDLIWEGYVGFGVLIESGLGRTVNHHPKVRVRL